MNDEQINLTVSLREFHTILAALRLWQETGYDGAEDWMNSIATDEGNVQALDDNEIEELCQRINTTDNVAPVDKPVGEVDNSAAALLQSAVDQWRPRFKSQEDINGADCVDWLSDFILASMRVLKAKKGVAT